MSKKIIILIIILIVVVAGGYSIYHSQKGIKQSTETQKFTLDAKNCTYLIEGQNITLVNGYSEKEVAPGSASKIVTKYFGNEVAGDFNNDGFSDIAFILTQEGGGSGTFYYLAAALGSNDKCLGNNAVLLGDRIAPQTTTFKNGEIIVNYAERKPDEPMTVTPSIGVSKYFKVIVNQLLEDIEMSS